MTTTTESQITSGKAESTIDTPEFRDLLLDYKRTIALGVTNTSIAAIITHIKAVREKDREAEREKLKAQITHMTHRMNTALAANRQLAARQAPDMSKLTAWLAREMPAGTVIGDPAWWAPRILQAILSPAQQEPRSKE